MSKVLSTTDYSIFKRFESNREVKTNEPLENSILKRNRLASHPIVVNGDMKVVDGQHRLQIAEKHGLTIYYIVDKHAVEQDMVNLNSSQRNWKIPDYLHHFKTRKYPEYIFFEKMIEKYKIPPSIYLRTFAKNSKTKRGFDLFKEGKFEHIYNQNEIEMICEAYREIRDMIPSTHGRVFANFDRVLLTLLKNKRINIDEMIRKSRQYPDGLIEAAKYAKYQNIVDILLEKVYNRGKRSTRLKL